MDVASSLNFGKFDTGLFHVLPNAHKKLKDFIDVFIFAMLDFNHLQIITLEGHKILAFEG
jgi:hypothetical protein